MKKLLATVLLMAFCFIVKVDAAESIPYACTFEDVSDLDIWSTFNRDDDEECWSYGEAAMGGWGAQSKPSANFAATDNWLVSPAIHFENGGRYELSFMAYTAYYCVEKMQVTMGTQPDPESQTTILQEITIPQVTGYYGYKVSVLMSEIPEGDYYIGLRYYTEATNTMLVTVKNFSVSTIVNGNIAGVVKSSDGTVLKDAKVTLDGIVSKETVSDANGAYSFSEIPQGDYNLSAELFGYNKVTNQRVTVTPENTTTADITMYAMTQAAFSGYVKDINGSPVAGASVSLDGYGKYRTYTDAQGKYMFEKVYVDGYSAQYKVDVKKNNFEKVTATAYIYSYGENSKDFSLKYLNLAPCDVTAEATDKTTAHIEWHAPVDMTELKYDNDEASSPMGFSDGHEESHIFGSIFREPMTVHEVKWYTIEMANRCQDVNIFILGVDENGEPTGEVLYSKENVISTGGAWSSHTLDKPLFCPNGFMVAFSGSGFIALAKDSNPETVGGKTQLFSNFISATDAYRYFEDLNWTGALMIRAEGESYEQPEFTPSINYDVFRFEEQDMADATKWQKIAEGVTGKEYDDTGFGELSRGNYYYAVEAVYPVGNMTSEAAISNVVFSQQSTSAIIRVTTNSVAQDAVGAVVKLESPDGNMYSVAVDEDNKAVFDKIWKAEYVLNVKQPGFNYEPQTVDFTENESYEKDIELVQILAPVINIDIADTENSSEKLIMWNLFADIEDGFEDEEAYADFEINPTGKIGWKCVDNDGFSTYSFNATTFPGMGSPMGAIIMNGHTTEPSLTINTAHSGMRELAFIASRSSLMGGSDDDGDGEATARLSDDYLISPELSYHKDFKFGFYARTYQSQEDRLESFRVGYSTTDSELGSFEYVTDGYISVPEGIYMHYEYDIPKEAKYVVLNSHSDDVFMLLVDDITIKSGIKHSGELQSYGDFAGYNVYIDGVLVSTQDDTNYLLDTSEFELGDHTASVTKVYKSGESEALSVPFTVSTSAINGAHVDDLHIYVADNKLHVNGEYKGAAIYNIAGMQMKAWEELIETMDLSSMAKGVYIIKLTTVLGKPIVAKIVIK